MPQHYRIFIDESRQTYDKFMVLGGVICPYANLAAIQKELDKLRCDTNMTKEFKWTKVSRAKLDHYKMLIDAVVDSIEKNLLHFKAVVFDTHEFDHKKFSNGDVETTFYKLMYQFILHKFGKYLEEEDFAIIHLDQRNSSYPLSKLKMILNAGIRKKYQLHGEPIRSLDPQDSKKSDLIQVADVLMGAIGFEINQYHLAQNAAPHKCELVKYIAEKNKLNNLCVPTPWGKNGFEIWHFHFKARPQICNGHPTPYAQ